MANLQAIKDEITNNPVAMPYPAFIDGNDVAISEIMNNSAGTSPRTVNNESVDTGLIRGATTFEAFDGLVAAEETYIQWITVNGVIPVNDDTLKNFAGVGGNSLWAVADRLTMEPRMLSLMQFQGSRAQEIAATIGTSSVTPSDIANARNLP